LAALGFDTFTVAGDGEVDRLLPGLAIGADQPPSPTELAAALDRADLVVVENLCSLPLNPGAAEVTAAVLRGRPALLHHHDLPWQRPHFAGHPPPPTDPRWRHVTINDLSRRQLADHGIGSTTIYNSFDLDAEGDSSEDTSVGRTRRLEVRRSLGVPGAERLVLQPTRAIPRKNVGGGMAVAAALHATYWLLGPAEDGFDAGLEDLVAAAACPVVRGVPGGGGEITIGDAYRACDVVTLPSTWEGFGNPSIESVLHRRPLAVGPYPVADELAAFGFEWFALDQMDRLGAWLNAPDPALLTRNLAVAAAHFSLRDLPDKIAAVLPEL
jgi:glycosyltransferase involved in cell wall biosynthesis